MPIDVRYSIFHVASSRRRFRAASWALLCCSIASLPAACTGHGDDDDAHQADATQSITADWIHPSCTPDALAPPATVTDGCNGPWTFGYVETSSDRNVCGEDTTKPCESYNSCTSWDLNSPGDFGDVGVVPTSTELQDGFFQACAPRRCQATPLTQYFNAAANRKNQLLAGFPAGLPAAFRNNLSVTGQSNVERIEGPDPETGTITTWFSCTLTISNLPVQTFGARPVCGCAHFPAKTCTRASGTTVTAPGLTRPPNPGALTFPGDTRTFTSNPVCLTCDQLPADTDVNLQAKFNCFDGNLAGATGNLRSSLVARMKLLFQLSGERLTAAQRTRIQSLYDQDSTDGPVCSTPLAWDSACQTEAGMQGIPSQLQLCQDLATNDAASAGIAGVELPHCFDQLAHSGQISTPTCRSTTRDAADAAAQIVLGKTYPPLTGDLSTQLSGVLASLASWWTAATTAAVGDRDWLVGHSNTVIRQLWTAIERARLPLPAPGSDFDVATLMADLDNKGFPDDFGVVSAMFSPSQAAPALLLTLSGDALQPIADRLARLEVLHDVGCRFAGCRTVDTAGHVTLRSSATSELVHALAVLPDHDALAAVLAAATKLPGQQPVVFSALTRVRDQHAYLDTAWAALGRTEPFSQLASIADPPTEAATLATVVRAASVAWDSYQGSGEFVPWNRPRLTTATLQQPALVSFLDGLRGQVTSARSTYEGQRLSLVNDLLTQSRATQAVQSELDRRAALRDQDTDLMTRSLGMESHEASERAAIAGFQATFEALINAGVLDTNASYQTQTLTPFPASAANAQFPGSPSLGDPGRDAFHTIALHPGESLRLHVTGSWSPTCAILHSQLPGPNSDFEPIRVADAQTGPEGFWVSNESDSFSTHASNTTDDFRNDLGVSAKVCASSGALGSAAGVTWEICAHEDADWIWTTGSANSNGSNARTSASFASGIRLPNTPFPVAPAGSLVAVLTPTGHNDRVLDVRVVHPDELIVAPALDAGFGNSVDVHLVVNDLGTCGSSGTPALQIEAVKSTPLGNAAQAVGAAMAQVLTSIEAQAPAILDEGELTTEEAAALRSTGWALVQQTLQASGFDLAGIPYDLHQLFDAFLEREIASVARRSEMHAIGRQRVQLQLTDASIAHDLGFDADQSRLLLLIPRWRLRDLSGVQLAQVTGALSEALSADVAQVFELRDPGSFTGFGSQVKSSIDALIDLDITASYEGSVAALESFAQSASTALAGAVFELPDNLRRTLVVAIPKAPTPCTGVPCTYKDAWMSVAPAAAQAFWTAAQATPFTASVTLTPTDLYSALGTGSLDCGDVAPVIRRMAMYLETGASTIDLRTTFLDLSGVAAMAGAPVVFPRIGDVLALDADKAAGVPLSLPTLNGNVNQVSDRFGASTPDLGTGAGLSPFTTFRVDMTPFQSGTPKAALAAASAVLLVFEVERRVSTSDVQVPGMCTPLTP